MQRIILWILSVSCVMHAQQAFKLFNPIKNGNVEQVGNVLENNPKSLWDTMPFTTPQDDRIEKATPLHVAVALGHVNVVEKIKNTIDEDDFVDLLWKKSKITTDDGETLHGMSPLHVAAYYGQAQIIKALLEVVSQGQKEGQLVSLLKIRAEDRMTPLHFAVQEGHLAAVKVFLDQGVALQVKARQRMTPLHIAAQEGYVEIVKAFLKRKKASEYVLAQAFNKLTPLHLAALQGHADVVEHIIEKHPETMEKRARIDGVRRMNPLHMAAQEGHVDVVKVFLKKKQARELLGMQTDGSLTPLHLAASHGHAGVVEAIIKEYPGMAWQKAKVEEMGTMTPFHAAAYYGHDAAVRAFLQASIPVQKGVSLVHSHAANKMSALHLAAMNGHANVVTTLIEMEPDLMFEESLEQAFVEDTLISNARPIDFAREQGHADVVEILKKNMYSPIQSYLKDVWRALSLLHRYVAS